jgi:hypothetical protein
MTSAVQRLTETLVADDMESEGLVACKKREQRKEAHHTGEEPPGRQRNRGFGVLGGVGGTMVWSRSFRMRGYGNEGKGKLAYCLCMCPCYL